LLLLTSLPARGRPDWPEPTAAHEIGERDAREASEPRNGERPLLGRAVPELLDALQDLEVPPANLPRHRLQHLPAAEGAQRRRLAQHERLAPRRRHRLREGKLPHRPIAPGPRL